jgi:CubicO group peptidase (beta-lactamase class C family)
VSALGRFLREEVDKGSFPGGVALAGTTERILEAAAAGDAAVEPEEDPISEDTRFDLASLTKPLASGALTAAAISSGLDLASPPGRFLPDWKQTRFDGITLASLLTHTSGLRAWYPLYVRGEGAEAYRRTLATLEPEQRPGAAVIYSDLNFVLLGDILETFFSAPLATLFDEMVAAPAKSRASYAPGAERQTAATEKGDATERAMTAERGLDYPRFRTGVVRGEVHDGNALRRGGVSGHAGLFGTARDVWHLARRWLLDPPPGFLDDRTPDLPEARGLAWQLSRGAGSAVPQFSSSAFGHTGFTGTSLWVDPERDLVLILLTNRIHPEIREKDFHPVRRRFHEAALAAHGGLTRESSRPQLL